MFNCSFQYISTSFNGRPKYINVNKNKRKAQNIILSTLSLHPHALAIVKEKEKQYATQNLCQALFDPKFFHQ